MVANNTVIRRAATALIAVVASTAFISGCATAGAPDSSGLSTSLDPVPLAEPTTVQVAVSGKFELNSPLFLADAMGEFEKENLSVEITVMPSSDSIPALAAGQVDVVMSALTGTSFNAIDAGAPIYSVYPGGSQVKADGFWVRPEIAAQGAAGLKGATIATSQGLGTGSVIQLSDYLATAGLTLADVKVQIIPITDLAAALESGAIDGALLYSPAHLPFEESGSAVQITSFAPDQVVATTFFGPNLRETNPEVGQAYIRALRRTVLTYLQGDYKSNPEVAAALEQSLELSADELNVSESLNFNHTFAELENTFAKAQELWISLGGDVVSYTTPKTPEQYVDSSFYDRIVVP